MHPLFPCILCYHRQDELAYLAAVSCWHELLQERSYLLPDDVLIDSQGCEFRLTATLQASGRRWSLPELTALVQRHFFAQAQSCVVKIQAPDIATLYTLLAASPDS